MISADAMAKRLDPRPEILQTVDTWPNPLESPAFHGLAGDLVKTILPHTEADRDFWAFQPPRRPSVPRVNNQDLVRNALDAFLLEKLEAKELTYSPETDRWTLLRRLHLDLTGTPPSLAEIDARKTQRFLRTWEASRTQTCLSVSSLSFLICSHVTCLQQLRGRWQN